MIMALLDEMWVAEAVETPRPMVITTTIKTKSITGPRQRMMARAFSRGMYTILMLSAKGTCNLVWKIITRQELNSAMRTDDNGQSRKMEPGQIPPAALLKEIERVFIQKKVFFLSR